MSTKPNLRLTNSFLRRVAETGLTDSAVAAAIGVSKQFYSAVKLGKEQPTLALIAGAVKAGLVDSFDEVAELAPEELAAA